LLLPDFGSKGPVTGFSHRRNQDDYLRLDEARRAGKFTLYAYVIMPEHLHVITDSQLTAGKTLQFINGTSNYSVLEGERLRRFFKKAGEATRDLHRSEPGTCRFGESTTRLPLVERKVLES
jgi:hypothetical protein